MPEAPSPVSGDSGDVSETVPVTVEPSGVVGATAEGVAVGAVIPGDVGDVSPGTVVPEGVGVAGEVGESGSAGTVCEGSVTVGAVGLIFADASIDNSAFKKNAPQKNTAAARNKAINFFILKHLLKISDNYTYKHHYDNRTADFCQ